MKALNTPFTRTALASALLAAISTPAAMAQDLMLEEVIVTAQKRAESVQDIAATVNVVSGDAMDEFSVLSFGDAEQLTAGLSLTTKNARNATISMRGISIDPEAGTAAAVDVYWNEMAVRSDIAFTQLYDLERMEILRGPQGTLQGRTSPAGAINIITRRPNLEETEGYVSGTVSDDDGFNGQVAFSMPLIEGKLAARVAYVHDENDSTGAENTTTGDDAESEADSLRVSVAWDPTDFLSTVFTWQNMDREVDDPRAIIGVDSLAERPTLEDDDRIALAKTTNYGELDFDIFNYRINWDVAGHDLTTVLGYVDSTKDALTENDRAFYINSDPDQLTFQTSSTEVEASSIEIRLASQDNDFWDYMVGLYYLDQETDTVFDANTVRLDVLGLSLATTGDIPVDNEETGIFTFNKFYLSDVLQLEFGLRWVNYDRYRAADVYFDGLNYLPPALAPFEQAILDGFAANFPINAVSDENKDSEDDTFTGSAAIRWDWTDEVSLYASYNRGYRPGGISIVPDPDVQFLPEGEDTLLYDEEESDAIELGFKSRLLDGRATLNGALYYQQFDGHFGFVRGVQVLNDIGEPVDISGGLVFNGDANIWGMELEGQIRITENWLAGGMLAYSKGEWDDAQAPCNEREGTEVLGYCNIDGEDVGGEPDFSLSLNSEYMVPLAGNELYFRGLYKYTGERNNIDASAGIGPVLDEFEEFHNINLYTGIRSADFTWDVSLWVKNLLDEDEIVLQTSSDQYDTAVSGGSYNETAILKERSFGLTARYNF